MTTAAHPPSEQTVTPRWIRPKQWRLLTGMSMGETFIRLRAGDLRGVKVGKSWYIPYGETSDFFKRFERNGRPAA